MNTSAELLLRAGAELCEVGQRLTKLGEEILRAVGESSPERPSARRGRVPEAHEALQEAPTEPEETPAEIVARRRRASEERSVGKNGTVVNYEVAKRWSIKLGTFSSEHFQEKLGLKAPQANRWLSQLVSEKVVRFDGSGFVSLIKPPLRDWVVDHEGTFSSEEAADGTGLPLTQVREQLDAFKAKRMVRQLNGSDLYEYVVPESYLAPKEHPTKPPPEKDRPSYALAQATGAPVRIRSDTRRQRSVTGAGGIKGVKQRNERYEKMQTIKAERAAARSAKAKNGNGASRRKARNPV